MTDRKIIEYKILEELSAHQLESHVNTDMKSGYEVYGLWFVTGGTMSEEKFYQAMVKYDR